MARYKLKLKRLDFISAVDVPAQETATALLVKRKRKSLDIEATARVVKTSSDELGLVFGWALTSKAGGTDYFDLHGDNIVEEDLIRVAAEFMERGGATDEQHDFEADGRVVFAMPLTAEVAKSFGIQTDTTGLMVAIKPSPEVFAKFKAGEYTGFSIAGIGERLEVKSAENKRVQKALLYTNEVDGHAHAVRVYDDGSLYVEHATMAGAEYSHSHGIVFENGVLTILADSGHTHEMAEGQPSVAVVPADAIVVQASARANKSTQTKPTKEGDSMKIVVLSEAQYAHYSKLSPSEQEAFINMSSAERDAVIEQAAKADPVVFKGERTGIEVRKSQGEFARKLAEQAENLAKQSAEQAEAIAKRDEEIEKAEVAKAAADLFKGKAPGADEAHQDIVRALRKSGLPAERLTAAMAVIEGLVNVSPIGKTAPGGNPGKDPEAQTSADALASYEKKLVEYAKANNFKNVWTDARAAFNRTEEGAALKRAYDESLNG